MRRVGVVLSVLLMVAAGCAADPSQRTHDIEAAHAGVSRAVDEMLATSAKAREEAAAANGIVKGLETAPEVPARHRAALGDASKHLDTADKALAIVPVAGETVRAQSDRQAEIAHAAAAGEAKAQKDLKQERDHWLGYKARVLVWSVLGLGLLIGGAIFVVRLAGGAELLAVAGELLSPVFVCFRALVLGAGHLFTLGLPWLASKIVAKWETPPTTPAASAKVVSNGANQTGG